MRRWIIAPLLVAVSQHAFASGVAPVWDRSNTLACRVVSAEICRYPGGVKTCTPTRAAFDAVKIDYGKSQVNLLAAGRLQDAWTIFGVSHGLRDGADIQHLHLRRTTESIDVVLSRNGVLRFVFQRAGGDLSVEARCNSR